MGKKVSIKSMINGRDLYHGELEYDWQKFIIGRQEKIEEKIDSIESFNKIEKLLEQINDDIAGDIREAIISRECKVTYIYYNRGFLDCLNYR
jgi:hypothetical protein